MRKFALLVFISLPFAVQADEKKEEEKLELVKEYKFKKDGKDAWVKIFATKGVKPLAKKDLPKELKDEENFYMFILKKGERVRIKMSCPMLLGSSHNRGGEDLAIHTTDQWDIEYRNEAVMSLDDYSFRVITEKKR